MNRLNNPSDWYNQRIDDDVQVYSYVNYATRGSQGVQVAEAWYEQSFFKGKILGTIGLLDPSVYFDDNKIAHDETMQFLIPNYRLDIS